ncbi:MAG: hypothetical protein ACRDUX_29050, partial [Mycobacterium sp.]
MPTSTVAAIALHKINVAIVNAVAEMTRCLRWRDHSRITGEIEFPTMTPMLYAGYSSAAAQK